MRNAEGHDIPTAEANLAVSISLTNGVETLLNVRMLEICSMFGYEEKLYEHAFLL